LKPRLLLVAQVVILSFGTIFASSSIPPHFYLSFGIFIASDSNLYQEESFDNERSVTLLLSYSCSRFSYHDLASFLFGLR
jgi:hypothetical protein